ncbi:MAG TPA: phosphoglycerate dehydrogenase [Rhodospirillaceae bacterium]|nr:MAG: phosphoglycerate dehydrogenase [Alphaproteobacteria bacterium GWF2_58_20]HAU29038.1 phosphoglycerate dehydrogenase [Rhodospirillaceae bacterium]
MTKILVAQSFPASVCKTLRDHGMDAIQAKAFDMENITKAEALLVDAQTPITADMISAGTSLRTIGIMGTDEGHVDVAAATAAGIVVMNTPYGNITAAAEHTLAMIFALARKIPQANASLHAGQWTPENFPGIELAGRTLGVIGCGQVGSRVAEKARALGMRIIVNDPYLSNERADELHLEKAALETLLANSDIITLHLPLNDRTRGMMNAEAFTHMKAGALLVNCGHGALIEEAALEKALGTKRLAGAALDSFAHEPLENSPFFAMDNVILTPHLSFGAKGGGEALALQVAGQVTDFLSSGAITCALNAASLTAGEAEKIKPFMDLADQLGSFIAQIADRKATNISIDYCGEVADLNIHPLTAIILRHVLALRQDGINTLNATEAARSLGIHVVEKHSALATGHPSLIIVDISGGNERHSASATLFGGLLPRLVAADDVAIEARLTEHMLYIRSADRPGLIGRIGTALGEANINIGSFYLGRNKAGGDIRCLISVDAPIASGLRDTLAAMTDILQATPLHFG